MTKKIISAANAEEAADKLLEALKKRGVKVNRFDVVEALMHALDYDNINELMADSRSLNTHRDGIGDDTLSEQTNLSQLSHSQLALFFDQHPGLRPFANMVIGHVDVLNCRFYAFIGQRQGETGLFFADKKEAGNHLFIPHNQCVPFSKTISSLAKGMTAVKQNMTHTTLDDSVPEHLISFDAHRAYWNEKQKPDSLLVDAVDLNTICAYSILSSEFLSFERDNYQWFASCLLRANVIISNHQDRLHLSIARKDESLND